MQQRYEFRGICFRIEHQQSTQLCVAILLDDVDDVVLVNELPDRIAERECPHAAVVQRHLLSLQPVERLLAGTVRAAHGQDGGLIELRITNLGLGHQRSRGFPLHQQPIDDLLILVGILGVATVLGMPGATREVRPLGMRPGNVRYGMPSPSTSR